MYRELNIGLLEFTILKSTASSRCHEVIGSGKLIIFELEILKLTQYNY